MQTGLLTLLALLFAQLQLSPLQSGDHTRYLTAGGLKRSYLVHVPPGYNPKHPTPVVLVLHGAAMNGPIMQWFSGLSKKADAANFIAVYPNGTGPGGALLTWNAGLFPGGLNPKRPDDVAFIKKVLADLATVARVDCKRVYAVGMSNGGMMAYRLAAEMPDRLAAIASVAGVMCLEKPDVRHPMPILHFHGTKDGLVPFKGARSRSAFRFPGVEESLKPWLKVNGCGDTPTVTALPTKEAGLEVVRKDYRATEEKAPVTLYVVNGGGHTWPGGERHAPFLGATTLSISANDLIWDFFRQFRLE